MCRMQSSDAACVRELEERYESLKQTAAWFWIEGDREAEAATERKMLFIWEKLQQLAQLG